MQDAMHSLVTREMNSCWVVRRVREMGDELISSSLSFTWSLFILSSPVSWQGGDLQMTSPEPKYQIREVWASNLETEMAIIRELLPKYPFVAMVHL